MPLDGVIVSSLLLSVKWIELAMQIFAIELGMDDEIFVNSHTNSGNIPKMLALLS